MREDSYPSISSTSERRAHDATTATARSLLVHERTQAMLCRHLAQTAGLPSSAGHSPFSTLIPVLVAVFERELEAYRCRTQELLQHDSGNHRKDVIALLAIDYALDRRRILRTQLSLASAGDTSVEDTLNNRRNTLLHHARRIYAHRHTDRPPDTYFPLVWGTHLETCRCASAADTPECLEERLWEQVGLVTFFPTTDEIINAHKLRHRRRP